VIGLAALCTPYSVELDEGKPVIRSEEAVNLGLVGGQRYARRHQYAEVVHGAENGVTKQMPSSGCLVNSRSPPSISTESWRGWVAGEFDPV